MADIFVDTAGWANLVDQRQPYHAAMSLKYREARDQGQALVTTNFCIAELVALMISPLHVPKVKSVSFIESLKHASHIEIVTVGKDLEDRAWELFKQRLDKEWSLVDCISFQLMREKSMVEALTSDHHFEQAGFQRLLK